MVAKSTKSSPSSSPMHIIQYRTQTFSRSVKVAPKTKLRWPHTVPIPEDLALAGFYYLPYEGADDNVCCYLCEKNMGGWEETDDPLKEHLRGNKACAWAVLRDLLVRSKNGEEFGDDVEDPRSEKMNNLREATFGKWWPHDEKKGWNPKSKKMARAGFYYTPTDDSEDMVNCPYCLIGLDGWEPKDDPLKEHKSRTPTCPFFVGLGGSLPSSNASSPVKSAKSEPTTTSRSRRNSGVEIDDEPISITKNKNKRRMTRQIDVEEDEEIFATVESPPSNKRRKSTRATIASEEEPPQNADPPSTDPVVNTPSKRKSRRATTNPRNPRASTVLAPIDEPTESPTSNRRVTRSAPTLLPTEDATFEIDSTPKKKTPVKPKAKHTRTKSRKVSALSKIVAELDKTPSRRTSRSAQSLEETLVESIESESVPETIEEEPPVPKKRRSRVTKAREGDHNDDQVPTPNKRKTRQSIATQPVDDEVEELPTKPATSLIIPKKKRASTRAARTTSTAVSELPEIEETEKEVTQQSKSSRRSVALPVVEIPDPKPEPEENIVPVRGKKATRGRGRSTTVRKSAVRKSTVTEDVPETSKRRVGRPSSKRDISAVYDDMTEVLSPPAKRKASGLRSIQKIPTPSDDSESDIFEDSKSTFSDFEEVVKPATRTTGGRRTMKSRSQILTSGEQETEEPPSTIYRSADDYRLSPPRSSIVGKSKREMVDNAKKELQEEIWREKVANGEIGIGGSSEDEEKENAAEEKGKKPTRTVRGKGSKGRKAKGGKKGSKIVDVSEEDDRESIGESHALVVKAMISPLRPGPLIPIESTSEESSDDDQLGITNGQVTPVQSPKRKALNWTPAQIKNVSPAPMTNGELAEEEEDMTIEQWMRWVINDEVHRLEQECEKLVNNLEKEGDRARKLLENLV